MDDQAISMGEAKQKLARLEDHMPAASDTMVHDFGRYLADYLNPQLVPMGFVTACELAIYDLQQGKNGFTGKPTQGGIAGYPPMLYGMLRIEIPAIAEAVFPEDFAMRVKECTEAVNALVREQRASS